MTATCLACAHAAEIEGSIFDDVYRCDECGATMFYGQRVVVEPNNFDPARPLVLLRLEQTGKPSQTLVFDARSPGHIAAIAKNLLSLVTP